MSNPSLHPEYTSSWAIVIGINDYSELPPLLGAVNDASAIADLLNSEFNFPANQIHLLLDDDATQPRIREHLELIATKSTLNDRVLIYFAGHGQTRKTPEGGEIGYLATSESIPEQWHTFLQIRDITNYSHLIPAKHVFFIFDACFSGLALTRGTLAPPITDIPSWLRECMTHKVRQVLTAGLAEQPVGDLTEDGHSIFTSYLLRGLNGAAMGNEGEITASQLIAYVTDEVMKDKRSKQKPASGDIEGSEPGGDLVFKNPALSHFIVPSNIEGGIDTGIALKPGDKVSIVASGIISYDSWNHFTNADGLLTTYKGQPLVHAQDPKPMAWPHPEAYKTNGNQPGLIGSLIGWVGEYSPESAFYIGEYRELTVQIEGNLHLSVNDAQGTYDDNKGEFGVTVKIS
jgi:hypothetical protein